jgi:hypothetical protein
VTLNSQLGEIGVGGDPIVGGAKCCHALPLADRAHSVAATSIVAAERLQRSEGRSWLLRTSLRDGHNILKAHRCAPWPQLLTQWTNGELKRHLSRDAAENACPRGQRRNRFFGQLVDV